MTHKIIKTDNYLLVVDDSLTIGKGYALNTSYKLLLKYDTEQHLGYDNYVIKKIIAHLPLNGLPILEGVDLLPPYSRHQEDGLDNAVMEFKERYGSLGVTDYELSAFSKGYNKAREVLIDKVEKEILNNPYYKDSPRLKEGALMIKVMLESPSQYPTEFECEMIPSDLIQYSLEENIEPDFKPKTTTNSQGQRVWVGKYK